MLPGREPVGALSSQGELRIRDEHKCFNCGACIIECLGGAFRCNLDSIHVLDREVPVRLRQSDRLRVQKLAIDLKERILEGAFRMAPPVDRISF